MGHRERRKQRRERRHLTRPEDLPVVTIAQYGPDDTTVTKVVATFFKSARDKSGEMKRWVGTGITESESFRRELLERIHVCGVRRIVLTTGVIGCIHEEEEDYPKGEECPFCPFWRGRDRWANADPIILSLSALAEDRPWPG